MFITTVDIRDTYISSRLYFINNKTVAIFFKTMKFPISLLNTFLLIGSSIGFHLNATIQFLNENNLKECVLLSCYNTQQNIQILKSIQNAGIQTNLYNVPLDIKSKIIEKLLYYRNYRIGAIYNMECSGSLEVLEVLEALSIKKLFSFRYVWLMFGRDLEKSKLMLANQDINVDSEVSLAIPTKK